MTFRNTQDPPESKKAYWYHVPTVGKNTDVTAEYTGWTALAQIFKGNWKQAVDEGLFSSEECEDADESTWPVNLFYEYPATAEEQIRLCNEKKKTQSDEKLKH